MARPTSAANWNGGNKSFSARLSGFAMLRPATCYGVRAARQALGDAEARVTTGQAMGGSLISVSNRSRAVDKPGTISATIWAWLWLGWLRSRRPSLPTRIVAHGECPASNHGDSNARRDRGSQSMSTSTTASGSKTRGLSGFAKILAARGFRKSERHRGAGRTQNSWKESSALVPSTGSPGCGPRRAVPYRGLETWRGVWTSFEWRRGVSCADTPGRESQRDSVPKPRVARHELPWETVGP